MLEQAERDYVRELGRQAHELAVSPEYEARRRRWRDVNALRRPDRSPVWCKPIGCWRELLPESALRCRDPFLRDLERLFRHWLIKHDIGDDSLIPVTMDVPAAIVPADDGDHVWGLEIRHHRPAEAGGAWTFDPSVKEERDLEKLSLPTFMHDRQESQRRLERHHEVLDGVMPVRLVGEVPIMPALSWLAADMLGLDAMMLNLALKPEMIHRLMAFLQAGVLKTLDEVEAMGVLTENNEEELYCSDSLRKTPPGQPLRIRDLWGQANSQEFELVSPTMWREFLLEYQRPVLERFGLVSYGCCETLTRKIDGVLTIRNLRIFVCSAWTSLPKVVEAVGDRYAIMWRQKATDVVYGDPEDIRRHLDEGMRITRGCYRQVVLRELQTLGGDLRRLHKWARFAKDAAEKHC